MYEMANYICSLSLLNQQPIAENCNIVITEVIHDKGRGIGWFNAIRSENRKFIAMPLHRKGKVEIRRSQPKDYYLRLQCIYSRRSRSSRFQSECALAKNFPT